MSLQLTSSNQVLALAPDASSAAAGKKLSLPKHWKELGQSSEALWGACQGSGKDPYQVRVDLATLTITCSCPSRKLPCKHGLGLLLIAVNTPAMLAIQEPPEWVATWLAKRAATRKQKEDKQTVKAADASPSVAQFKTAEKRQVQMMRGLDQLDLWLHDLIRNGLASVEAKPLSFWQAQKAQMVDAQMEGIGNRILRMAAIPHSSPNWPEKLLTELGKLTLLTHAFRRTEELDAALQMDIRQLVGKPIKQEEVSAHGQTIRDEWLILGQQVSVDDKVREQWTWMLGVRTGRPVLILQFAFGQQPFSEVFAPGTRQEADLTFWPSASPLRARLEKRRGEMLPLNERLPGMETIEEFLVQIANSLARLPWQERFLCTLRNVTPVCVDEGAHWYVRDTTGAILPLIKGEHWQLLALSGGHAVDLAGVWNGEALSPLGVLIEQTYYIL